jgi:AcrR family transcriptional regulator
MMSSNKKSTRERILDATWQMMEESPGHAIRMADIAKAAGVSRQAVYLHFSNRADLLIATTRHMDDVLKIQDRLEPTRNAASGRQRLGLFIAVWGSYLPQIAGVARALLVMRETDAEARAAWDDRMAAMREGCAAAIKALAAEEDLADGWTIDTGTDLLCTMLSFQSWDQLTTGCGWTNEDYIARLSRQAERSFARLEKR